MEIRIKIIPKKDGDLDREFSFDKNIPVAFAGVVFEDLVKTIRGLAKAKAEADGVSHEELEGWVGNLKLGDIFL